MDCGGFPSRSGCALFVLVGLVVGVASIVGAELAAERLWRSLTHLTVRDQRARLQLILYGCGICEESKLTHGCFEYNPAR